MSGLVVVQLVLLIPPSVLSSPSAGEPGRLPAPERPGAAPEGRRPRQRAPAEGPVGQVAPARQAQAVRKRGHVKNHPLYLDWKITIKVLSKK